MTSGKIQSVVVSDDARMIRVIEEVVFQIFSERADIGLEFSSNGNSKVEELADKVCSQQPQIVVVASRVQQIWAHSLGQQLRARCPQVKIIFNLPGLVGAQDLAIVEIMRRAGEIGKLAFNLTELRALLKEFGREL